jgi:glycosyltransferase involved in cell wall biosynthesis
MNDTISVIIPAYNAEKYLAESIESVLAQTVVVHEIIVVDDGSTDRTAEIVKSYDARYIYQDNAGVAGAMNTGFQAAVGQYFASNDADDLWLPEKLALQLAAFKADPTLDIVFGHMAQFLSPDVDEQVAALKPEMAVLPAYASPTMLIKRQSFERVGLFNANYTIGDFVEWYSRATEANLKSLMLETVVAKRRIHDTNTGLMKKEARSEYLSILRAAMKRRREQS